ncbi:probable serine/threonine-protein kinase At1g54610 [Vigna radiata var. radiata]|uniref:Probable serine/threonine-protein kinase At1g54610 n=1 Tax=Vigna radiata var. radiata TaxID=3916 RepID=A0A1S3V7T0_VIGRR|nr:probable serine/threonine-protein kinase At1g54610 [Vigna radiata var. radiata]XP_014514198.1 probable serine/threonine-protein kinase At1g54610 [Vigna radiata var. radiata]XP_014514199.1 probable serine/threonine-protein kinase At1g54610 [Vigna radiata var. radiata]XP_022640931.1 probable serine/threonine-protein kinase At1g54610 [Vigna radiata var. radiata]
MGCIIGKEVSSGIISEVKEEKSVSVESNEKVDEVATSRAEENVGEALNGEKEKKKEKEENGGGDGVRGTKGDRRRSKPNPRLSNPPKHLQGEQVAAGWPPWLTAVCGEALSGWIPRKADTFEKIDKIGQGTYSNVYKAKDTLTGKIVALKKVRFDNLEPESVKFMAREILILRRLDHPNVIKLEGLVTSRMSLSLYLVFDYMVHDLAGLAASPDIKFTEPQVKCYTNQLLSGLEHCHSRNVLHRDIKGSNLLINDEGILKIADFGLASFFDPDRRHPMTSRVVTLWYRPLELLLGATEYGVAIDLWSVGCILGELLAGKPIMPGRTEVEQLHKIYKLCGSPSDEYWKKLKMPNATLFKPRQPYRRCIRETFKDFPPSSFPLIETLLAIDPAERKSASDALRSEFFTTEPYACDPLSLPKYPPTKEMDAKRRDDEARRSRAAGKTGVDGPKKHRIRDRAAKAAPAPEANAELQSNMDRRRLISHANAKSKSEKFPPPHEDGQLGFPLGSSNHIDPDIIPSDISLGSTSYTYSKEPFQAWSGPIGNPASISKQKKHTTGDDALDLSKSYKGTLKHKVKGKKIPA